MVALVNGHERVLFPAIECVCAIGAPIMGFGFSQRFVELRKTVADFATNLTSELAVVEIEILGRSATMGTGCALGHFSGALAMFDRRTRMAVSLLKTSQPFLPVRRGRSWWRGLEWPERVYIEVPVVRMFFLKSSLGLSSGLRLARTS